MRVLVYTDPGSIHSERLLRYLSRSVTVGLYWPDSYSKLLPDNVLSFTRLPRIGLRLQRLLRFSEGLPFWATVAHFRPDIIHVQVHAKVCPKFKQWARDIPVIFTSWGHIPLQLLTGEFGKQLSVADAFTADSQALLDELHNVPGGKGKPDLIFRFGVDTQIFHPGPPSLELKGKLGIPRASKIIFAPRSLRPTYNHETLVRAIPLVLSRFPDTYFLFVNNHGHRYVDAENYICALQRSLTNLGVIGNARFLDHMEHSDIPTVFRTSDLAVSIPIEDGFPATIFEAMACGTPLIVSNLPDYRGVVDSNNAVLIEPLDANGLADAIVVLLSDQEVRARLREAGYRTVAHSGRIENEVNKLVGFYSDLLTSRGRNA